MPTELATKDPDAEKNYTWDFSDWLGTGETISSYSFPDFPAGITNGGDSNTTTTVTIKLTGGTAGESYDITCRIVTTAAQTEDRTVTIPVAET